MIKVTRLYHVEVVRFDNSRLQALVADLGDAGADRVISRAMEEIAVRLSRIEAAYDAGALDRVGKGARSLVAIADQTGLASVRDAAGAVASLSTSHDSTALAACVARLIRVGETSLVTVWDAHGISL
ncbi:hypothetical protein ACRDNQ_07185 [Palleronia sp. KMU-117]|uniref:hypothetical protein n=1 Tax=Palleronia sp. KMU-117 TaxID=3434108 RepID=UPI003D72B497